MADGLIKKIKKDKSIKFNGIIVVTGGDGELIKPYMKQMDVYDADLTLKGLNQMNNLLI